MQLWKDFSKKNDRRPKKIVYLKLQSICLNHNYMGQFLDTTVKNVIEEINVRYFLPDIQREYVWLNKANEKKIEQLFDSILRGYPISTFLFWKLHTSDLETTADTSASSNKLNFQLYKFIENYDERKQHNEKIDVDKIRPGDLKIVLDGQQRLTSLYIGLKGSRILRRPHSKGKGKYDEKKLYLNLRYSPDPEKPDDNYKFEFHDPNNVPVSDDKQFWFKVGDILNMDSIINYALINKLSQGESCILERLKNAICSNSIISYYEEEEKSLDKVLKIFIRVNNGGTALSYSDLLMSILTASFSTDIRSKMNELVTYFADEGFAVLGRDQILKSCLILAECSSVFKLSNFNRQNIGKIENGWKDIQESLKYAMEIVKDFGYAYHLSSGYIISAIALYLHSHKLNINKRVSDKDNKAIGQFIRNAQITSYFTSSLDTKLSRVSSFIKGATDFHAFNEQMKNNHEIDVSGMADELIDTTEYGGPAVLPLLQLLYPNMDFKNRTFHIDHIYPKSKFQKNQDKMPKGYVKQRNNIFNLQLLEGRENIIKKDKDPEVWLQEEYKDDLEGKKKYKRDNYIPENLELSWKNIKVFKEQREKALLEELKKLLQ